MDKTIVTELVFDVPGTEMIEALSKKAEECRSKADAFGQILEEALVAGVTAESVQKACKLSGEEFRKEYLPEAPQFVANLQRHREYYSKQAVSWGWSASHVVTNSIYRISIADADKMSLIDLPSRLYGEFCDYSRALMKEAVSEGSAER